MPRFTVDIEVWCSCGEGLCRQSDVRDGRNGICVTIEPCEKCLERAREAGMEEANASHK